ncbi:hypothetical protein CIPOMM044M_24890 [Citrobacter portucalensis]
MQVLEIAVNIFPQMDKPVIAFTPRRFVCCQAQRRDELVVSETPLASDTGIRNNDICQQIPGQIECFTRGHAGNNACRIREKRGGRCMTDTTSGQVTVNFVRYHPDIIGQANFNNPLKFIRPPDSSGRGHCCKVSDEAAFCLIQRPYISKTLLTRRISPRGSP